MVFFIFCDRDKSHCLESKKNHTSSILSFKLFLPRTWIFFKMKIKYIFFVLSYFKFLTNTMHHGESFENYKIDLVVENEGFKS